MRKSQLLDLFVAGLLLLIGVGFFISSLDISSVAFDPIGSAKAPMLLSFMLAFLASLQIVSTIKNRKSGEESKASHKKSVPLWAQCLIWLAVVLYVYALSLRIAPFSVLTALFCTLSVFCLTTKPKDVFKGLLVGVISGAVIEVLFTQVFFIDIPSFWGL